MSIISNIKIFGKYLDEPALVKKVYDYVPAALVSSAGIFCLNDTFKASKEDRKKTFIRSFSTLAVTTLSALIATRGLKIRGKQLFEGLIELPEKNSESIKDVLCHLNKSKIEVINLIKKVENDEVLSFENVKFLLKELGKSDIDKVIPDGHCHNPFEELGKLSLLGLIPVFGGIAGGVLGDKLTKNDWKKEFPNKVKEGTYQYLNNIFLCNIGAGIAMLLMNKLKVKSKSVRFIAMLSGVIGVGVFGGSAIANFVGTKFINPLFDKSKSDSKKITFKDLNKERHPEAVDLCLHIDDLASVGFLSGLKWIGPVLPFMYCVSGYRAGIGYRNGNHSH